MIKIEADTVYERAELADAFPHLSQPALTRTLLAWGGMRPYAGSRKVFIRGEAILQALTKEPAPARVEVDPLEIEPPARRSSSGAPPRVFLQRRSIR